MITLKEVKEFAVKYSYDDVIYKGKWKKYDVYEPIFNDDKEHIIGLPFKILVKGNSIRMSTPDESFAILDFFYPYEEENENIE